VLVLVVGIVGIYSFNVFVPNAKTLYYDRLEPAGQMAHLFRDWSAVKVALGKYSDEYSAQNHEARSAEMDGLFRSIEQTEHVYEATYLVPEEKTTRRR